MRIATPLLASLAVTLGACAGTRARVATTSRTSTSPLFEFHSDMWLNLHQFLYETARARKGLDAGRPIVAATLADTAGFGALSPQLRADWNAALDYYATNVASKDILFDSSMVIIGDILARRENAPTLRGTPGLDAGLAEALDRGALAYRALWWPRHDAINRKWIADLNPLLARHGIEAASAESRIMHMPWARVRVDVSAYTNWAGAYTSNGPSHINISSVYEEDGGIGGFETLFHEVLHTMDDSAFTALTTAFQANKKRYYRDPTHPFIFYTAGETTRGLFPGYVPFAERRGMWALNSDYMHVRPLLQQYWQPYLDGHSTLEEAMTQIAAAW